MLASATAAVVLALCLVFMVRLGLGDRRRAALDHRARLLWLRLKHGALGLVRRRSSRKSAEKMAEEAIRRARGEGDGHWEGNVYKPKSFKRPPRDKLH